MKKQKENSLEELKKIILEERKIVEEMASLFKDSEKVSSKEEKRIVFSQMNQLKNSLKRTNINIPRILENISFIRPLHPKKSQIYAPKPIQKKQVKIPVPQISLPPTKKKIPTPKKTFLKSRINLKNKKDLPKLEKETLKRLGEKKKKEIKLKEKKPSKYIKIANKTFSELSMSLLKKDLFKIVEKDLIKTNLQLIASSYISVILLTSLLSIIAGIFIFLFFLFFEISGFPIITRVSENIGIRLLKVFWILFAVPIVTFFLMYFYPSVEKKSIGNKIDRELPFAAINMSAISGSLIDISQIFSIIISTKEYPHVEKEFTKLINEINVYGYDLVTALRKIAFNTPSKKLGELLNGLATTINSGGDLPNFFDKRAETLLFEYRIEREKRTKFSETFMDIYISAVIAAPMILLLVLMMMKISGLGIALSTSMISLIMVLGVSLINIVFLTFLHLKQPAE